MAGVMLLIEGVEISVRAMRPGEADDADGLYYGGLYPVNEIAIRPEITPDRQAEVLLHECIHAYWEHRKVPPRVREETAALHLGEAFAQLLGDNPNLVHAVVGAMTFDKPIV